MVAGLLVQELQNNQPDLALAAGAELDEVRVQQIVNGIWADVDVSHCPLINVYLAGHEVATQGGGLAATDMDWRLHVDIYAASAETAEKDMTYLANKRLEYLARQVWATLESEQGYNALKSYCKNWSYSSYAKAPAEKDGTAVAVMTGQLVWKMRITEDAEMLEGFAVSDYLGQIGLSQQQIEEIT